MSPIRKWTLALKRQQNETPRKITKIIGLNGDGFSVLAPYHKAKCGFLCKVPVDLRKALAPGVLFVPADELTAFTVDDRAKLSYHTDGFIQFSSENPGRIISGRDPTTGEPKGLGLMTRPLTTPIRSGPSASVTVWGLEDFDLADESNNKGLIVFEPKDFCFRGCLPEEATLWEICVYAFPVNVLPPVRYENGIACFGITQSRPNGPLDSVVPMRSIHLPKEKVFLGVYVIASVGFFPSPSGWILGGAGRWSNNRPGHVLQGFYPRDSISAQTFSGSLDRVPKPTSANSQQ